ncbi:hypothetical protein COW57_03945 [Candidatus Roizmanbacteria bacterium CG17_big_fil_post_rev_8_21_14_2_50_39_7]|uniref:Uncharacterized protein n=2 Tax=Candidatus Roizmaniibacteriota TaxID=1752723 RepID=A0A2M7EJC6_9BACT|nr:MAG: hypothetical protein COW96_03455 [Candidatus Roizmanbacteria bacterium CG22_combo_CG10-13_8_21_14_all_33_16]PIV70679.1 MAG: hypothetical protein COW57_03945 [Candidatus Roizmanbacteria bacterium CG17_big_fil_post_rev_8_21_14_2_50_39_7]
MLIYTFGTIFKYDSCKFIYLLETFKVVYVAKILDDYTTKSLEKMYLKKVRKSEIEVQQGNQFCFIKLTCDDFKNQAAVYGHVPISTIYSKFFTPIPSESISNEDLIALKNEIQTKPSWEELREKVKAIKI